MVHGPEFYNRRKGFEFGRKKGEPKTIPGVKVENRIGVQAPASAVWEVLHDVAAWPTWNPLYTKVSGMMRIGERLTLTRAVPGRPEETLDATVVDWTPNELLHTKRTLLGGFVTSIGYWEIDVLDEEASVFSNGELFMGLLASWHVRRSRRALRQGYALMGEALKAKVEVQWRERPGSPTSVGS
jgi:hypothetical protein